MIIKRPVTHKNVLHLPCNVWKKKKLLTAVKQKPLLCFSAILAAVVWSKTVSPSCKITFVLTHLCLWKKMNEPLRLPCQHICIKPASPSRRLARMRFEGGSSPSDSTERLVNSKPCCGRARLCPRVLSVALPTARERASKRAQEDGNIVKN